MSSTLVHKSARQHDGKKEEHGVFAIFRNKNYRLYFGGQFISLIGTWMQMVALSWFTYTLTNSPLLLAIVGASRQLPSLLVMPFAGVFADRLDRKKVIVYVQILAMIQASLLAFLTTAFMGAAPIGSLVAGALAGKIGLSNTILGCGVYCLIVSIMFDRALPAWRKETRPIYIEKGLLIAEEEAEILAH